MVRLLRRAIAEETLRTFPAESTGPEREALRMPAKTRAGPRLRLEGAAGHQAACSAAASSSALASTVSGTVTISRPSRSSRWRAWMTVSPTIR
jgi:hypothetical protein